uniref:Uncharacterized protein n=1 Tax=viral metagenome TaxID=1070528 RepID=A0A6C0C8I5_9ZZZZ
MPNIIGHNLLFNITDQRKSKNQEEQLPTQCLLRDQRNGRKSKVTENFETFFRTGHTENVLTEEHKSDNRNRNKLYADTFSTPSMMNKKSDYVEKKYGIKTLLQTKSKFVYPFNSQDQSISEQAIDSIEKYKKHIVESDQCPIEPFIESIKSTVTKNSQTDEPIMHDDEIITKNVQTEEPIISVAKESDIPDEKNGDQILIDQVTKEDAELLNDIKIRTDNIINMDNQSNKAVEKEISVEQEKAAQVPKIEKVIEESKGYVPRRISKYSVSDEKPERRRRNLLDPVIATSDNEPVEQVEKIVPQIPMDEPIHNVEPQEIVEPKKIQNDLEESTFKKADFDPQSQLLMSRRNIESMCIKSNQLETANIEFPKLSLDDISVSLKVVGDLPTADTQTKLIVVNSTHLAIDTSMFQSISRYGAGQSRELIFNFLEHMYSELVNNINLLLADIDAEIQIDDNILIIRGIICKLAVFLHKYENMRSVYKSDSSMFAKLGNNRDKFHSLMTNFFRKVILK